MKFIDQRIDAVLLWKALGLVQSEKVNEAVEASASHDATHKLHRSLDYRLFKVPLLSICVVCALTMRPVVAQQTSRATSKTESYSAGRALKKCTVIYASKKIGSFPALVFCSFEEANPVSNKLAVLISSQSGWKAIPKLNSKGYWEFVGRSVNGSKVWAVARNMTSEESRKNWHVWHSDDGGRSWIDRTPPDIPSAWLKISALYFDSNGHGSLIFYLSAEAGDDAGREPGFYTFVTENEGKNWRAEPVAPSQSQAPNNNIIIAAEVERDLKPRTEDFYRLLKQPMQ